MTREREIAEKLARTIDVEMLPTSVLNQGIIETLGVGEAALDFEMRMANYIEAALLAYRAEILEQAAKISERLDRCGECNQVTKVTAAIRAKAKGEN